VSASFPCAIKGPKKQVIRPPWCDSGTCTVTDPLYGEITLTVCPKPLRCWKSGMLPDGSYWMWLGGPWHENPDTPLSGYLFFAPSWEYWQAMQYVSQEIQNRFSTWIGQNGCGRVDGQEATVQLSLKL
jgi:hypothetical protein